MDRWKIAAVLGWSLVGVVLLAGAGDKGEVRTKRLVVEDGKGHDRIVMEMLGAVPRICLSDAEGKSRLIAWLGQGNDPVMKLRSADGNREVVLMAPDDTEPSVSVHSVMPDGKMKNQSIRPETPKGTPGE